MEIELTSTRPDGTWTWRAAGARQPKGELDGGLLSRSFFARRRSVGWDDVRRLLLLGDVRQF